MYLCYDIRGIQAFVFQIPRLKHIIGGSALIDRFDRKTVPELAETNDWKLICAGGGKGAFSCSNLSQADAIRAALMNQAKAFGADIRFGLHADYSEAAHCADHLYPYLPENLQGHPCPESGLYPVEDESTHPVIKSRHVFGSDKMARWFENRLLSPDLFQLPPGLPGDKLAFFHNVDDGSAGSKALGSRNRWAVICMDGNGMGSQFRVMAERNQPEKALLPWISEVGAALDGCTAQACRAGIGYVVRTWLSDEKVRKSLERGAFEEDNATIIPIRPLVVGGDDIAVLCHSAYAATFVSEACRVFETESLEYAEKAHAKGIELWPATGGRITISAGILYCSTSLPLATAIPYAETLLAMAKSRGRALTDESSVGPSPACVDFEVITESLLDHPATRRARQQLRFFDKDIGEVVDLTMRPYALDDFNALLKFEALKDKDGEPLPGTILHELHSALSQAFHDRAVFRHRLAKHQGKLADALGENPDGPSNGSRWQSVSASESGQKGRCTDILDMALLFQESRRMEKETAR